MQPGLSLQVTKNCSTTTTYRTAWCFLMMSLNGASTNYRTTRCRLTYRVMDLGGATQVRTEDCRVVLNPKLELCKSSSTLTPPTLLSTLFQCETKMTTPERRPGKQNRTRWCRTPPSGSALQLHTLWSWMQSFLILWSVTAGPCHLS